MPISFTKDRMPRAGDPVVCDGGKGTDGTLCPRWYFTDDRGRHGACLKGEVSKVCDMAFQIKLDNGKLWSWPLPTDPRWDDRRTGWIKLDLDEPAAKQPETSATKKTQEFAMKPIFDLVRTATFHGAHTAGVDQASDVLLDISEKVLGGILPATAFETEQGRAVAKYLMAVGLTVGAEMITSDAETQRRIRAVCALQIEASSRDFIQPKLAELQPLIQRLLASTQTGAPAAGAATSTTTEPAK